MLNCYGMSISDIINAVLVAITFFTLLYTIRANRKVNRLNFRPYADIGISYYPGAEICNLRVQIFKSPARIHELLVEIHLIDDKGAQKLLETSRWTNVIRMPSDAEAQPFEFPNFTKHEIPAGQNLKVLAQMKYGLIGVETQYQLSREYAFTDGVWVTEKLIAT